MIATTGRQDALRGNTPPRPSVPHSMPGAKLSPAEESLASAVAFHVGEILGELGKAPDEQARSAARKVGAYKGVIAALAAAIVALFSWTRGQVEAYGDSRAAAAASAVVAEAKAEEAAAYLEETRQIAAGARDLAESTSSRVEALDRKLDRLLGLAEAAAEQPAPIVHSPAPPTRRR